MRTPTTNQPDSRADFVAITGNTFPVKEQLKTMGGFWDAENRVWRVPKAMKMAAEVLAGNAEQVETLPGMEEDGAY